MASEWKDNIVRPVAAYLVLDAAGEPVSGVTHARETDDGVECVVGLVNDNGDELVCESEGGWVPLTATVTIPGGMLVELES